MMLLLIKIDVDFNIEDGNVNNDLAALLEELAKLFVQQTNHALTSNFCNSMICSLILWNPRWILAAYCLPF